MDKTICFTGHRPKSLCGYNQNGYNAFVGQLAEWLKQFVLPGQKVQFISGGAQGFDQLAFWAVDLLKHSASDMNSAIVNTVYVPFKGQSRAWLKQGLFGQDQYDGMLRQADRVAYLQEELLDRKSIVGALMDRNHKMVNSSDLVIAMYEGDDWQTSSGGTAECMRYAAKCNKPIRQLKYTIENGNICGQFD